MVHEQNDGEMKIEFRLIGLDCRHCAEIMEQALMRIEGIQEAEIDVRKGLMSITCDEYLVCQAIDEVRKMVEKMEPGATIEKLVKSMF